MRRSTRPSASNNRLTPLRCGFVIRCIVTRRKIIVRSVTGAMALCLTGALFAQSAPAEGDKQPAAAASTEGAKQPAQAADSKNAVPTPAPVRAADSLFRLQMAIDKPLMTLEQNASMNKKRFKILKSLRNGVLSEQARKDVDEWAKWRMYRMTITEIPKKKKRKGRKAEEETDDEPEPIIYRRRLPTFNKELLQEIRGAGKLQDKPALRNAFRKFVLDRVVFYAKELLDNNFVVRLNAVVVLSRLNLVEGDFTGQGAVAYAPVSGTLVAVIRDKNQHEAVKVQAVLGLQRVLLTGRPNRDQKNEIALELMAQLDSKATMFWYPMRLIETLGRVDEPLITRVVAGRNIPQSLPFHVQTLMVIMRDENRNWIERAEAAKSLGRISLHSSVDSNLIAYEIVVLAKQMSAAYNKKQDKFYWNNCFWNVYLAFRPLDRLEKNWIELVKPTTLISKFDAQKSISDAYQQVLPLTLHVLRQPETINKKPVTKPIPAADITRLADWVTKNKPSNDRIAPGLPPLEQAQPMAAKNETSLRPAVLISK